MIFADRLTLDAPKRLKDGYMAVRAKAARTGVYDYAGHEVDPDNKHGLRDQSLVKVLRDDDTVFDEKSARSFIGKPITDNHPTEAVTADNWRQHARGTVMGAIRDGDYLAFDLLLTDSTAIRAIDAGKRELSNGYAADLEFGDFTAPDGTKCQARQTTVSGNHVALVDRGRAGAECRIGDIAVCDAITAGKLDELKASLNDKETVVKTFTLDGLPVNLDDASQVEAALSMTTKDRDEARAKLADTETKLAEAQTKLADAETKVKTLEDAKPSPADLRAAAKVYAQTVDHAKKLLGDKAKIDDDADEAAIRKQVVSAKLGDTAKDWTDDQIATSFATMAANLGDTQPRDKQPAPVAMIANDTAAVRDLAAASRY